MLRSADSYAQEAGAASKLTLLTKSNSLRQTAKDKEKEVEEVEAFLITKKREQRALAQISNLLDLITEKCACFYQKIFKNISQQVDNVISRGAEGIAIDMKASFFDVVWYNLYIFHVLWV